MPSEIGSEQIAFTPTFKGFRSATDKEVDGATRAAGNTFKTGFGRAAASTGASSGKSFKDSFSKSSSGLVSAATAEVAKASRELAGVRAKELDVTGRVRLAESQLAEARQKYAGESSQVIRAEERLATASRQLIGAQDAVKASTDRLRASKSALASASTEAAVTSGGFSGVLSRIPAFFGAAGNSSASTFGSGFKTSLPAVLGGVTIAGLAFGIGRGIGTAVRAGVDYGLQGVSLASGLSETGSAIRQVFGEEASGEIQAFASTADKALGQSRLSALKAAQTFGVFGKQAGLTGKPLANFSTGLVTLSGDLASFYDSSPDEAIDAIGAGLRGEAEPLRRFGVLLDDATLRQKALELGIYDGEDALTSQQRVLAAQAVIMDQTGIAQGDFGRTSEGLANQQRSLAASLENTQAKFGEALLPAFSAAASFANDTLVPRLDDVVDRVGPKLSQALEDAGPGFERLAEKAGPLIDKFTDLGVKVLPDVIKRIGDIADAAPIVIDVVGNVAPYILGGEKSLDRLFSDFVVNETNALSQSAADHVAVTAGFKDAVDLNAAAAKKSWKEMLSNIDDESVKTALKLTGSGGQLGSGFAQGIRSTKADVESAVTELADVATNALQRRLQIKSPSRVTERIGGYTGQGFTRGVIGEYGNAAKAMAGLAQISSFSSSGMQPSTSSAGAAAAAPVTYHQENHFELRDEDPTVVARKFNREFMQGR